MIKHQQIIASLSTEQKIRLLTDLESISDKKYKALGLPTIRIAETDRSSNGLFPSTAAIANSWDISTVREAARISCRDKSLEKYNLIKVPSSKPALSPYTISYSEDPILSGRICKAYSEGVKDAQKAPIISNPLINDSDLSMLDKEPDVRVLNEFATAPFSIASEQENSVAFMVDSECSDRDYLKYNEHLFENSSNSNKIYSIISEVSPDKTVETIEKGKICVKASYESLNSAHENYINIKKSISHGKSTLHDLEIEIKEHRAISTDTIDIALDNLIEFALWCNKKSGSDALMQSIEENDAIDELSRKSIVESTVLLKNENNILPIKPSKKSKKIVFIGNIVCGGENTPPGQLFERFEKENFTCSYVDGYRFASDRNEDMSYEINNLVASCDYIVLFLGLDRKRAERIDHTQHLMIPANQQALVEKLSSYANKIIAILSSDIPVDVSFAKNFHALMLAPLNVRNCLSVLGEIILGKASPGGRLARTVPDLSAVDPRSRIVYKNKFNMKIGPFIGYRYDVSCDYYSGFTFGHGLSFARFTYSDLKIRNGKISFYVKNTGKIYASETSQIYIEKIDSDIIRPRLELIDFEKVFLKPGEKIKIERDIKFPFVCDVDANELAVEQGKYVVHVGSSPRDLKLSKKTNTDGVQLKKDTSKYSDYLQSVSNIVSDNFTLEANHKKMKKSVKNIIYGSISLILSIVLRVYCMINNMNDIFLNGISIFLAVFAIAFLVIDMIERKIRYAEERKAIDAANKDNFADATKVPFLSADNMFVNEFDVDEDDLPTLNSTKNDFSVDVLSFIDKEFTLKQACDEFELFATEKGYIIGRETINQLFSSMAASRLIITKSMPSERFANFITLLGEYFGVSAYVESTSSEIKSEGDLLYEFDENGKVTKRQPAVSIELAAERKSQIQLIALDGVSGDNLSEYFAPFARYAGNPHGNTKIEVHGEPAASASVSITPNVWFVLNLNKSGNISTIPDYITEIASIITPTLEKTKACDTQTSFKCLNYYQMEHFIEKSRNAYLIDEDDWKKIDRLEEYVSRHTEFKIGNKLCVALERFASAYVACGGDREDVIDVAVSSKLIPSVAASINGYLSNDDTGLSETVANIFGEENSVRIHKAVIDCGI